MSVDARTWRSDAWTRLSDAPGPAHAPNTCRGYVERVFSPCEDASTTEAQRGRAPHPGFPRWFLSFLTRS